jgi:hypothetical protein
MIADGFGDTTCLWCGWDGKPHLSRAEAEAIANRPETESRWSKAVSKRNAIEALGGA